MLSDEHHLEFLSLQEGCTGLSESTLVKMPQCWKSNATAHMEFSVTTLSALTIKSIMHVMYIVQCVTEFNPFHLCLSPFMEIGKQSRTSLKKSFCRQFCICARMSSTPFTPSTFSECSFRNTFRVSNSLNPDQTDTVSVLIWFQTVCKGYLWSFGHSECTRSDQHRAHYVYNTLCLILSTNK